MNKIRTWFNNTKKEVDNQLMIQPLTLEGGHQACLDVTVVMETLSFSQRELLQGDTSQEDAVSDVSDVSEGQRDHPEDLRTTTSAPPPLWRSLFPVEQVEEPTGDRMETEPNSDLKSDLGRLTPGSSDTISLTPTGGGATDTGLCDITSASSPGLRAVLKTRDDCSLPSSPHPGRRTRLPCSLPCSPLLGGRRWRSSPSAPSPPCGVSRLWVEAALQRSKNIRQREEEEEEEESDQQCLDSETSRYCLLTPCICLRCPSAPPYEDEVFSAGNIQIYSSFSAEGLKVSEGLIQRSDFQRSDAQRSDAEMSDAQMLDAQMSDFQRSDFQSTDFQSTDFQRSDFQRSDFQRSDAQSSDAQRSDLQRLDFQQSDFQRLDFKRSDAQRLDFQRSDFQRSDAQRSDFQRSDFQRSDFQRSDFQMSDAQRSDFQRSDFQMSDAQRSDAQRSDFQRSDFQRSDAQRSDFQRSDAQRSDLQRSDAQRSDFQRLDFQQSDFQRSDFQRSDFQRSDAQRSDFQRSDFQRSNAQWSDFQRSDFQMSDAQGSDFQQSDFQRSDAQRSDFQRSDFQRSNAQWSDFQRSDFQMSDAQGSDFQQSDFQRSDFQRSDFHTSDFQRTGLSELSFPRDRAPQRCESSRLYPSLSRWRITADSQVELNRKQEEELTSSGSQEDHSNIQSGFHGNTDDHLHWLCDTISGEPGELRSADLSVILRFESMTSSKRTARLCESCRLRDQILKHLSRTCEQENLNL